LPANNTLSLKRPHGKHPMNEALIHKLFEQQVSNHPDRDALVNGAHVTNYRQLNEAANQIAHTLHNVAPSSGTIVGVFAPASELLVAAMLGTFKSGDIYMPLALDFAQKRFAQIFEQTKCPILIVFPDWLEQVKALIGQMKAPVQWVLVPQNGKITLYKVSNYALDSASHLDADPSNPPIEVSPEAPNYIFYTSGSTGEGKAILGQHKSLTHFLAWQTQAFNIRPDTRTSLLSQVTFDASLRDVLLPLMNGGRACIPPADLRANIPQLIQWLETQEVTLVHCVPSVFRLINKELSQENTQPGQRLPNLQYIFMAGEVVYGKDLKGWRKHMGNHTQLVNLYGTSETTMAKTFHVMEEVPEDDGQIMHVGQPIADSHIIILNRGRLCRIGEIGEVYIKTPYRTLGYYQNEALNKEVFVQNPLVEDKEDIVHKTGDLGRYRKDRSVEILGRLDDQVKVNGIRVELKEVEAAVLDLEAVSETVLTVHQNADNQNELICYYTGQKQEPAQLRQALKTYLNENIIPSYFVHLEEFPLTINGKVDKKALPKPEEVLLSQFDYEPVQGETEALVEDIWKRVLNLPKIGRSVSFFKIGGTSLKAIQVISWLYKECEVSLKIADIFNNPTVAALATLVSQSSKETFEAIAPVAPQENYAVSSGQKRLWTLQQLEEATIAYNMNNSFVFHGAIDTAALQKAFATLMERHESLRTIFKVVDGEPRQFVLSPEEMPFVLDQHDVQQEENPEEAAKVLSTTQVHTAFDLANGPLLKVALIQTAPQQYVFSLVIHHIVADDWSMQILQREILALYAAYSTGQQIDLPALRIHYKDYTAWQQNQQENPSYQDHINYWQQRFSGTLPVLELPTDKPRPGVKTYAGTNLAMLMPEEMYVQVEQAAQAKEVTPFMWLLGAFKVLLYRYSGQTDLIVGTPTAGRVHADLEDQIGFYINTLPLRTQFDPKAPFDALLEQIKDTTLQGFEHQTYPFDSLVEDLDIDYDPSRSPVFDVMFVLQNAEANSASAEAQAAPAPAENADSADADEIAVTGFGTTLNVSKVDLELNMWPVIGGIQVSLTFNTDLYEATTAQRFVEHYLQMVQALLATPGKPLSTLSLTTAEEQHQMLQEFNPEPSAWPQEATAITLFEQQVQERPANTVVIHQEEQLSFEQLNESANRLAHWLIQEKNIKPGQVVALICHRNLLLPQLIWGVIKAGAAYLPLDPQAPTDRQALILNDAQPALILTDDEPPALPEDHQATTWGSLQAALAQQPTQNPVTQLQPAHPAYIIYTSGSTGVPKGVVLPHSALVCRLVAEQEVFGHGPHTVTCHTLNYTFDASVFDLFIAPTLGGTLVIPEHNSTFDPAHLLELWDKHNVTSMHIVPLLLTLVARTLEANPNKYQLKDLKYFICGGDNLQNSLVAQLKALIPHVWVNNMYGPTEAALGCTVELDIKKITQNLIGNPLPNTTILMLDDEGQLVPPGFAGEICIGGPGLAIEYLNSPELTQERFIKNPYAEQLASKTPGFEEKLYRSGDMGHWTPEGKIVFLGRKDQQIKVRGYRIEIGEIEQALLKHNKIEEVAVTTYEESEGVLGLIAYITSDEIVTAPDLQDFLKLRLPGYMIPGLFAVLPAMPITESGKIDRQALPEPDNVQLLEGKPYVAPQTELQEQLVQIWENILKRKPIGIHDNFFNIGGHSLKATQLMSAVYKEINVRIKLRDIFDNPTVEELAALIKKSAPTNFEPINPIPDAPHYPVSNAQKRMWIVDQLSPGITAYNMPGSMQLHGRVNIEALNNAFKAMIERYEILRTTFITVNGEPQQKVHAVGEMPFAVKVVDFSKEAFSKESDKEKAIYTAEEQEWNTSFDLQNGPLMLATLRIYSNDISLLSHTVHHIISDGWSNGIFQEELMQLYAAFSAGQENPLPPLSLQYRDYVAWQQQLLESPRGQEMKAYWLKQFEKAPEPLAMPTDYPRPANKTYEGDSVTLYLEKEFTSNIKDLSEGYEVSLFMMLTTTLAAALYRWTGQTDIVIGSPIAGREHPDTENQLGLFLNNLAIRIPVDGSEAFDDLMERTKDIIMDGYENQAYPSDLLIDQLDLPVQQNRNPLFDVNLTLQNTDQGNQMEEAKVEMSEESLAVTSPTTKFDLTINAGEYGGRLLLAITYAAQLFDKVTIKLLADRIKAMMYDILDNPGKPVDELTFESAAEKGLEDDAMDDAFDDLDDL